MTPRPLVIFMMEVTCTSSRVLPIPRWQAATKELAALVPQEAERVFIYGQIVEIDGASRARIQNEDGLGFRLQYLTGKLALVCNAESDPCATLTPPFNPDYTFEDHVDGELLIELENATAFIRLPRKIVLVP